MLPRVDKLKSQQCYVCTPSLQQRLPFSNGKSAPNHVNIFNTPPYLLQKPTNPAPTNQNIGLMRGKRSPLGVLHTMPEGREAVYSYQAYCKKPKVQPSTLHTTAKVQRHQILIWLLYKKATNSQRKFGSDRNGYPTLGERPSVIFHLKINH